METIGMWIYEYVTRQEFESVKDKVEKFIERVGGNKVSFNLPYEQKTFSCVGSGYVTNISARAAFEYNGLYYRVDEICFPGKPFIVIECGTYSELINNIMEDLDPFPYDLNEDELLKEVKHSLGIEQQR